ncbi:MAG: 30S ribosomal protein S20 [Candidatus Anoxychlamydiales bacterium]|nr:30S ribosomal protein S20 [Candidatus Anoxychlamydiales bacterium]NGX40503.1 30S ribosomal protein S20 [Candidatus Anoxychlamydiales bacterium]HEU64311.1 30S ribosomal protein S20 [Chlamydiota bacterium]
MAEEKEKKKKVKKPTAIKRILQSERRNDRNTQFKSRVKTALKDLKASMDNKDAKEIILKKLDLIYSLMDKAVKKRVFKKNKADRIKSRCSKTA